MNMTELEDRLRQLVLAHGPSGHEDEVRELISSMIADSADEIVVDKLGNLLALQRGDADGPKVMLDAHTDEISLIVKYIDQRGTIWLARQAGMLDKLLPGQHVTILTRKGHVPGIIGCKSGHLMTEEDRTRVTPVNQLWADVGADSCEEAEALGVQIGDLMTYRKSFNYLNKHRYVCATGLDDRLGCLVLIEALRALQKDHHDANVHAVFSAQEEVGCRGTQAAAYRINPDFALVLDTGFAEDPATNPRETRLKIGAGPVIRAWEQRYTVPRHVYDHMISVAERIGVPYQREIVISGGTDAQMIHLTKEGIPTGELIVARRYSHSPVELASMKDVENTTKLTVELVKTIDTSFTSQLERRIK